MTIVKMVIAVILIKSMLIIVMIVVIKMVIVVMPKISIMTETNIIAVGRINIIITTFYVLLPGTGGAAAGPHPRPETWHGPNGSDFL